MSERPGDYVLILRPAPDAVPAAARLKRAMKMLWRGGYRLRVVGMREVPAAPPPTTDIEDRPHEP